MTVTTWEESAAGEVSVENLLEFTRGIARWVRLSGTPDELRAVEYVRDLLAGYGLETEILTHDAYISLPGSASLTLTGDQLPAITHSFGASTPPEGLQGQVVDCGTGHPDALAHATGSIALIEGLAGPGPVQAAERAGAVAQIYVNGPRVHEMIVSPVWGSPGRADRERLPRTPVVSVTEETAAALRQAISLGIPVRLHAEVDTGWRKTPLLLASLTVSHTEDFVLFSGHIDSWHYGAMDNGTANATMVEVARIMAGRRGDLSRGLRLAFWSGHSHGRYSGSAWYADAYWSELHDHCVAHVNVDSTGGQGATMITNSPVMASTLALARDAVQRVTGESFEGSRVSRMGDQSFLGLGVPSLWVSVSSQPEGGLGWWWHTPEDTIDKIDPVLLQRDAGLYALAVARLLHEPLLPLDVGEEAREVRTLLQDWAEVAGDRFDLAPLLGRVDRVVQSADRLASRVAGISNPSTEQAQTYNLAVVRALRSLIPINHTAAGPYGQDPALNLPPIPLLAPLVELTEVPAESDEARFLCVDLVRNRNQIAHALDQAAEALDILL